MPAATTEYRHNLPLTRPASDLPRILLFASGAMSYYPAMGFRQAENAFLIRRKR